MDWGKVQEAITKVWQERKQESQKIAEIFI